MIDIYQLIVIFNFLKFSWTYPQINQAVFLNPLTNSTFIRCPLDLTPSLDIQWFDEFNQNNRLNLGRFYRIENLEPSQRLLICSSRVSFNDKFYINIRIYDRPLPIPYFIITKLTNTSLSVFWQDDIYNTNANITSYELILKYSHVIQSKIRVNRTISRYTFDELNPNTNYSIEIYAVDIWNRLSLPKVLTSQTLPIDFQTKISANQIIDNNQIDQTIACYNFQSKYLFIDFNSSTIHQFNHIYNLTIFDQYETILFTTNLYTSFVYSIVDSIYEKYQIQLSISTFQLEYLGKIRKSCENIYLICTIRQLTSARFDLNIQMQPNRFSQNLQTMEIFYRKNATAFMKTNFQQMNSIEIFPSENYSLIMELSYLNDKFNISIPCSIIQMHSKSVSRFLTKKQIFYLSIISTGLLVICLIAFQRLKSSRLSKSTSIPTDQFRLYVSNMHNNQNYGFKKLFEKISEPSKFIGRNLNSYIAVREPMMDRRNEFWRMIWDNDVRVIIMIDDNQQSTMISSDVYWSEEYIEMYGNIEVTLVNMTSFAFHIQRIFSVRCITNEHLINSEHLVYHFQYLNWPPTLLTFIRHAHSPTPLVIHCSQTEIYMIIDSILKKLNQSNSIDIPSLIKQTQLIPTFEQFLFIYDLLSEVIEQMKMSSSTIEQQFYSIVENRKRTTRISIDLTYLHGYYRADQYLIVKHPLKDRRDEFWRTVWKTQSDIIVSLYTNENLDSDVYDYWPMENELISCEGFTVKLIDEYFESEYVHRNCLIQSTKNDDEFPVKILTCAYWPDSCSPIETSFHLVDTIRNLNSQKPIVVHDQFGGYRSGLFCALYTMKEQFENERLFNLYELTKSYDLKRPGIWHDSTDLSFLYQCEDFLRREYDQKLI